MKAIKVRRPGNDTKLSNKPKVIELTEEQYVALNKHMGLKKVEEKEDGD